MFNLSLVSRPRIGQSRLGAASFVVALAAPASVLIYLVLLATSHNHGPPEVPSAQTLDLLIWAGLSYCILAGTALVLGLAAIANRSRKRLLAWMGLGLSAAELSVVLGLYLLKP